MNAYANHSASTPRGVLRSGQTAVMEHIQLLPCAALADRVVHFWHVQRKQQAGEPTTAPMRQATLPHPHWHWVVEGGLGRVYGVQTGQFAYTLEVDAQVFGVKLRPGALASLAKIPATQLQNTSVAMEAFWPTQSAEVLAALALCDTPQAKVAIAQAFLLNHLPVLTPQASRANAILEAIAHDKGLVNVDAIGASTGLDKRAVQRLFRQCVGASPKWVVGRYRIHEAIERIHTQDNPAWADLALALGYFDQAHFINDFKALVGCTPRQYAKRAHS